MYGFAIIKPAYAIRVARASRPEALARAVPFFVLATVCYGSANGESNDGNVKKDTIRSWIVNESSDSNLWKRLLLCRLLGRHSVIFKEEVYGRC